MEIPTVRMADFKKEGYVSRREPCVIVDGLAACEDLRRWTPEHLAAMCGDVRVSVAVSFDGSGWRPSCGQRKRAYSFASVALRDAVRWITREENGGREFYVPQEPIEKFQPLGKDVTFGKPLKETKAVVWLGTANTVSILHHDMAPNLFAQVHGEKRFILYSPDQVASLYPQTGKQSHVSAVDPLRPDLASYPQFADARAMSVTVEAGQILFLPAFWWHHVTSLSVSISVSQWWRTDLEDYCNRTAARLMTEEYLLDGWAGMMRQRDMQTEDLLAFAERAAAVDQTMAALALCVILDRYDRWPDHDESTAPVEADVRQDVERLRQAVLDDEVYTIGADTIARLARRVRDESVLGAFARGNPVPAPPSGEWFLRHLDRVMSSPCYTTNAVLQLTPGRVVATGGTGSTQEPIEIADHALLTVLELFVHHTDPAEAYEDFRQLMTKHPEFDEAVPEAMARAREIEIHLGHGRFLASCAAGRNLAARSSKRRGLLSAFASALGQDEVTVAAIPNGSSSTRQAFDAAVGQLVGMGLIVPAPGSVAWGDLRRQRPVDAAFGFLRGTPIDRYYLRRFVDVIRARVTGHLVELGGAADHLAIHRFPGVTSYRNADIDPRPGVTIVGDIHDASLIAPASADAIMAFNVLEHCAEPWVVVDNMRRWLRPGGQAFCMVANAQRIHESPRDYWRPTPGGLGSMFRAYARHDLFRYGNPTSLIASYLGIAAEELRRDELDTVHPDYPVVTCLIAST